MNDFILDDQPTSDTFCMECNDGEAHETCLQCGGPMCLACTEAQQFFCRACHEEIDSQADDNDGETVWTVDAEQRAKEFADHFEYEADLAAWGL